MMDVALAQVYKWDEWGGWMDGAKIHMNVQLI